MRAHGKTAEILAVSGTAVPVGQAGQHGVGVEAHRVRRGAARDRARGVHARRLTKFPAIGRSRQRDGERVHDGDGIGGGKNDLVQPVGGDGVDFVVAHAEKSAADAEGVRRTQITAQELILDVKKTNGRDGVFLVRVGGRGRGHERDIDRSHENLIVRRRVQHAGTRRRHTVEHGDEKIVEVIRVVRRTRAVVIRPQQVELAAVRPRSRQRQIRAQRTLTGLGELLDEHP